MNLDTISPPSRSILAQPHDGGNRAMVSRIAIGHAPVHIVVQEKFIAWSFAHLPTAIAPAACRLAATIMVDDQIVLAVLGVGTCADPRHVPRIASRRERGRRIA